MAKPAKPAAAKKEEAVVADAPKSNKKLIIIIVVLVLIIAGGGGFAYMKIKNTSHVEVAQAEPVPDPVFIPLEVFTVNLQREDEDKYLQINITLKVIERDMVETIKAVLPEIRSKLNLLLSGKRPSEITIPEGKKRLATEIMIEANKVLGIHIAPALHTPVSAPVVASAIVVASAPAEGEVAASAPEDTEAVATEEAASAPAAEGASPVVAAPVIHEKKGIVDVLFTSFIIQ